MPDKIKPAIDMVRENIIVKHLSGSRAYGTDVPGSDTDYRGVFCADPIHTLTPFFPVREVTDATEEDTKYYELSHFMKLLVDCNPNIVETVWVDAGDIVLSRPTYWMLRKRREDMLSMHFVYKTFGYATAQLKRFQRNKVAYTDKCAMHFVRLTRMALETAETGQIEIRRLDAGELIHIRNGGWGYGEFIQYAAKQEAKLRKIESSPALKKKPNYLQAAEILMDIQRYTWAESN